VLAAAALFETLSSAPTAGKAGGPFNPWRGGATSASAGGQRVTRYTCGEASHTVTLRAMGDGCFAVTVDEQPMSASPVLASVGTDGRVTLDYDGQRESLAAARRGYDTLVWRHGQAYTLARPRPLDVDVASHAGAHTPGAQLLTAPMSGTIIKVNVREGDHVEARQTVVVLGAMKMEHAISAPHPGRVRRVHQRAGDVVQGGATLVELAALEEAHDA
jgi:biotin carboxyl carrier protein